jgi:hypothetical protein
MKQKISKQKITLTVSMLLIAIVLQVSLSSNGAGAGGFAASGGCTCHSAVQSNLTNLSITGIPATGWVPSTSYILTATVSNTNKVSGGFDINVSDGSLITVGAGTIVSGNSITHTSPKAMTSGVVSWDFEWISPANGTAVTFTFAGNAVNANNALTGDAWASIPFVYNSTVTVLPTISSVSTTNIGANTAKANCMVNANNTNTNIEIQYGLSNTYGTTMATTPSNVSANVPTAVSHTFTGLTPNTLYHYRIKATNSNGSAYSTDQTFSTTSPLNISQQTKPQMAVIVNENTLLLSSNEIENGQIEMFTMAGQKMQIKPIRLKENLASIDVQHLPKGVYIIRMIGKQVLSQQVLLP